MVVVLLAGASCHECRLDWFYCVYASGWWSCYGNRGGGKHDTGYPVTMWFGNAYSSIKWICGIFFVFKGFSAVMLPWRLGIDYGFLQILIAILFDITAIISFGAILAVFVKGLGEEK